MRTPSGATLVIERGRTLPVERSPDFISRAMTKVEQREYLLAYRVPLGPVGDGVVCAVGIQQRSHLSNLFRSGDPVRHFHLRLVLSDLQIRHLRLPEWVAKCAVKLPRLTEANSGPREGRRTGGSIASETLPTPKLYTPGQRFRPKEAAGEGQHLRRSDIGLDCGTV
jgi:hypothetical protein